MDKPNYIGRLSAAADIRSFILIALGASVGLNILLAIAMIALPKGVRHELIPPSVSQPFEVGGRQFDKSHIEQMGLYVAQLMLNVTPKSVRFQGEQLARLVSPERYAEMQNQVQINAALIERINVSTVFIPVSFHYDPKHPNRIGVAGSLQSIYADKSIQTEQKSYLVEFGRSASGSMNLVQFKETEVGDPIGVEAEFKEENPAEDKGNVKSKKEGK